jgi:hypothetical protein
VGGPCWSGGKGGKKKKKKSTYAQNLRVDVFMHLIAIWS